MTDSHAKVALLSDLAERFEQADRESEAEKMVTEALSVIAGKPAGWDRSLVLLADEVGSTARQATVEQQEIMAGALGCSRAPTP